MNKAGTLALRIAVAAALALFLGAFADSHAYGQTTRGGRVIHRDNERVTAEGQISNIRRDRDGYRVDLDRGNESFWVPERALRGRSRDFRAGASVRLGGVFRGGMITVDIVDWIPVSPPDHRRYNSDTLRGVIERVDFRHDTLVVRDEATGRSITVNMIRGDRRWNHSFEFDRLHRGDFITFTGNWTRGGGFDAYRIESVRPQRY